MIRGARFANPFNKLGRGNCLSGDRDRKLIMREGRRNHGPRKKSGYEMCSQKG